MDVWIMDTCMIDKWGAGHWHWGTGHLRGSHSLSAWRAWNTKRPELRRTSNKISAPSRAPRLQYYHIVVFLRGRGKGEREKEWKAGKCGNCGERGEGMITSLMQERKWLMSLLISAISHFRPSPFNFERSTWCDKWEMKRLKSSARWKGWWWWRGVHIC